VASEEIVVSIGAKIDELIAGFTKAADSVGESLGTIETHVADVSSSLEQKLAPATEAAAGQIKSLHESTEGIGGALGELKEKFSAAMEFTGLAVGIELFDKLREKLDELADRAIEFQHLGEELGVGSTAMQGLDAAANEAVLHGCSVRCYSYSSACSRPLRMAAPWPKSSMLWASAMRS
jgi:phage-related protein